MATLNLNFYNGEDRYSDGIIENAILRIVRAGKTLAQSGEKEFPVLYHLSPVRENILSWYPFREGACALEIGAGPGAITGVLCRRLKEVKSVDLSKRRCMINYERHKSLPNLEILAGNFNDMVFNQKFDYVILNGVFEYAGSFTEGPDPWGSFLRYCSSFLKEDGLILIAIENRLGLKYFSGAPEDHTDNYMEGLNNYPDNRSVHTFSRSEWLKLLEGCGLVCRRFYYPFPDYKFPNEIFTDDYLSADHYARNNWNFNPGRLELFREAGMAETLCDEGVLNRFMNSFLIEAGYREADEKDSFLYAKINSDRGERFRIQTCIYKEDGVRYVVKSPLTDQARQHLERMQAADQDPAAVIKLNGRNYPVSVLKGELLKDGSLRYPWLNGINLGAEAADAAHSGDFGRVKEIFDALYGCLMGQVRSDGKVQSDETAQGAAASSSEMLEMTLSGGTARPASESSTEMSGAVQSGGLAQPASASFTEMFGTARTDREFPCMERPNIDMILDNIFLEDDGAYVIDAEWVLSCPAPAAFVFWRAVNEFYSCHPAVQKLRRKEPFLADYGISEEDAAVFWQWADHFEKKYVGANSLEAYVRPVKSVTLGRPISLTASLYLDRGNGFSEEDVLHESIRIRDGHFKVLFRIPDPAGVRSARFDPIEGKPCICRAVCGKTGLKALNAAAVEKEGYVFLTKDPSFLLNPGGGIGETVKISGRLDIRDEDWALEKAGELLKKARPFLLRAADKLLGKN